MHGLQTLDAEKRQRARMLREVEGLWAASVPPNIAVLGPAEVNSYLIAELKRGNSACFEEYFERVARRRGVSGGTDLGKRLLRFYAMMKLRRFPLQRPRWNDFVLNFLR